MAACCCSSFGLTGGCGGRLVEMRGRGRAQWVTVGRKERMMNAYAGSRRALFLSTTAFAVAFSVWGLLSGLAPIFKQQYGLTTTQVSLMVAIPLLLGSVGRLPLGLLADRFGAKPVLATLLLLTTVPSVVLSVHHRYPDLLLWGFFLGLAGTSFSVGVAFTS